MDYAGLDELISANSAGSMPLAVVLCESAYLADATIDRLSEVGFDEIVALGAVGEIAADTGAVKRVRHSITTAASRTAALNRIISWADGRWIAVVFNGDFLFYPFSETRTIGDFADFLASERRTSAAAYTIDLYSDHLNQGDEKFDPRNAYFDTEGWYGFEREGKQAEVFGGVGWRFEEFLPSPLQRINRPAFFQASEDVALRDDLWFEDDEYNAISCPWHNNPTMALMSVRRALALKSHPNFRQAVPSLIWPGSEPFKWRSDQLIAHGMMEAGQWL